MSGASDWGFCSDAGHLFIVREDGNFDIFKPDGSLHTSLSGVKANRVWLSPDGAYGVAYYHMGITRNGVSVFTETGDVLWKRSLDSSVWCVRSQTLVDETVFAVGTSGGAIHIVRVADDKVRKREVKASGAVVSLDFTAPEEIVAGTWQESALTGVDFSGKVIWQSDMPDDSRPFVRAIADSGSILVINLPVRQKKEGEWILLSQSGEELWRRRLSHPHTTSIIAASQGRYFCLGVENQITHKGESILQHSAILLDAKGRRVWKKGSVFLAVIPLLVNNNGVVVFHSGDNRLFLFAPEEKLQSSIRLEQVVVKGKTASGGNVAAIECADGKVYLLRCEKIVQE